MKTLKFLGAAVLPLLMLAGCGGGGSSTPTTVSDFCNQYAAAVCQINCGPPMASCVTYQTGVCQTLAAQATAGGKRIFNSSNMGDCISKLKAAYGSTNPITPSTQASIDLACNYVFQGKLALLTSTDVCTTQFDCAGTTNGSIICDPAQHLCATQLPKSVGQQCSDVGAVCATNSYCATSRGRLGLHGVRDQRRSFRLQRDRPLRQQLALLERHLHAAGRVPRNLHRHQRLHLRRLLRPVLEPFRV